MSVAEKNCNKMKNPHLARAVETLKEIRVCEQAYREAEKDRDEARRFKWLERFYAHKDFIVEWASRNAVDIVLKEELWRRIFMLQNAYINEVDNEVDVVKNDLLGAMDTAFEVLSLLAHSAAHSIHEQGECANKARVAIEEKIKALKDELASLIFNESSST